MKDSLKMVSVTQAAKVLTVSDRTIRRWIAEGRMPAVRLGKNYRIREAVVQAAREKGMELV